MASSKDARFGLPLEITHLPFFRQYARGVAKPRPFLEAGKIIHTSGKRQVSDTGYLLYKQGYAV